MSAPLHPLPGRCPACGEEWDGRQTADAPPRAGDLTVCVLCFAPLAFERAPGGGLTLAPLGPGALFFLGVHDPELLDAILSARAQVRGLARVRGATGGGGGP